MGAENFFLFGLTAEEVREKKMAGYRPQDVLDANPMLLEAMDRIASGAFSGGDKDLFRPLVDNLLHHDPYLVFADYQAYVDCQDRVSDAWKDTEHWTRMSILNAARMGKFSSDRAIQDYCDDIWNVRPLSIPLPS